MRNKEQKMSLFVSLHTFVEKPVRFEAPQYSIFSDNDISCIAFLFQPKVPAAWAAHEPWVSPHNLSQKAEKIPGKWRPSLPGQHDKMLDNIANLTLIRSFWTTHYLAFQERLTGIASDITFVAFNLFMLWNKIVKLRSRSRSQVSRSQVKSRSGPGQVQVRSQVRSQD